MHVEIRDRVLGIEDVEGLQLAFSKKMMFDVDLEPPEQAVFEGMTSACRRRVRKGDKVGVTIEEAADPEFADDYYSQLLDVFARQSLVPSYNRNRVKELIRHLHPGGRLLLLRARSADGECIATGIFPAMNKTMYFWGGASWRQTRFSDRTKR